MTQYTYPCEMCNRDDGYPICHCERVAPAAAPVEQAAPSALNPNESDPIVLWAEIARLQAAVAGPDGYASWQEAATAERLRRVRAEKALSAQQAAQPLDRLTLEALIAAGFVTQDKADEARALMSRHAGEQAAQPVATVKDGLTVAQPVAEVGDLIIQVRERVMAAGARNRDPLYTAAPSPVALADEQIEAIEAASYIVDTHGKSHFCVPDFARAIERAHGIQAGKDGAK